MNDTMWPLMGAGARLSEDGIYRYELTRRWSKGPCVCFIMLNPSTADATKDDPTIRKCRGFAQRWNMGALVVVNLFAYRATDPRELRRARVDITGGWEADTAIHDAMVRSRVTVAAWGTGGAINDRALRVYDMAIRTVMCLGLTKDQFPRHPLRLPYDTPLIPLTVI